MSYRCVGCNSEIGWDGKGTFSYTCPCGGHIFYNEETEKLSPPASLVLAIHEKKPLPHLDYLVGNSDYTSPLKERVITELTQLGAIWMKDCKQCLKDGTYQRTLEREKDSLVFQAEAIIRRGKKG